ncbi:MAG: hypothetical protein KAW92_02120 [Candidatus Cloacimonetes bacterium]|nr:hypothetical protein [Candidatus Cloacimonadota bacterium]
MCIKNLISFLLILLLLFFSSCRKASKVSEVVFELRHYSINSLEGLITQKDLELDEWVSSDGIASLKISVTRPTRVRLFETGDIDVENACLIYEAKLRTKDFVGQVYLEMLCNFPGKGEFFSRALESSIREDTEWTSQETPFYLKKGENPDNVKLNLVINGKGTVWIDDIRLIKAIID